MSRTKSRSRRPRVANRRDSIQFPHEPIRTVAAVVRFAFHAVPGDTECDRPSGRTVDFFRQCATGKAQAEELGHLCSGEPQVFGFHRLRVTAEQGTGYIETVRDLPAREHQVQVGGPASQEERQERDGGGVQAFQLDEGDDEGSSERLDGVDDHADSARRSAGRFLRGRHVEEVRSCAGAGERDVYVRLGAATQALLR